MKKYEYFIRNLDCPNCARKLEEELNKKDYLHDVKVNFNMCKLSFASNKDLSFQECDALVKLYEPDAYLEKELQEKKDYRFLTLLIGLIIGVIAYFMSNNYLRYSLFIVSYLFLLHRTIINAYNLLVKSKTIDENLLITISCIGALLINKPLEGIMVISLYTIGKILEAKALNNSRKSIRDLMNLKEPYANIKKRKELKKIPVEEVKVGDILIVKKGERVPVDAKMLSSLGYFDTSSLTGEIKPLVGRLNDKLLSGYINQGDMVEVEALNRYYDSTVYKILTLLESATDKKAKTETIISKASKYYTPIVLILAILVVLLLPLWHIPFTTSLYRGLIFLVVSCPCAIAISVPLAYFTGIGACSKHGILVKGSNYLDNLSNIKNIIFDKTGTLTTGRFDVLDLVILDKHYSKKEVIEILCKGEALSLHPIAKSILNLSLKQIDSQDVKNFKEIDGLGITFTLNKQKIKIGNSKLCNTSKDDDIHLMIDDKLIANIKIDDGLKKESQEAINYLKRQGIKTWMFTGDKQKNAMNIAKELGIDDVKYEMLPQDKFNAFDAISQKGLTAFVGDGINDSPVLRRSDIGISMGSGADASIEASDIVIMQDDLSRIPLGYDISKYTKYIIKQNLIFALSVKIIVLILSTLGLTSMWMAVFADTGVTLLTIINTLRILKKYKK